jgi:hypothetical protein
MKIVPDNRLIAVGTLSGVVLTSVTLLVGTVAYTTRMGADVSASRASDADHEGRLRTIEAIAADLRGDVRETKTDVAWIRRFLDRHPAQPGNKEPTSMAAN